MATYPLNYQPLSSSCWVTSMVNGILCLYPGKRVPFMAYNVLHDLLVEDGVFYYTNKQVREFEAIVTAVGVCTGLDITYVNGKDVPDAIKQLDYQNQVAVCDIKAGAHSILINGYQDGVFQAFDPYWEHVEKNDRVKNKYETYAPYMEDTNNTVNVRIRDNHLFAQRHLQPFQMGSLKYRFTTILTRHTNGA